jgi:hypothetical protein
MKFTDFFKGRSEKASMMRLCLLLVVLFVFVPKVYIGFTTKTMPDLTKNEITALAIFVGGKVGQRYFESDSKESNPKIL